jgi:hypothetical protein
MLCAMKRSPSVQLRPTKHTNPHPFCNAKWRDKTKTLAAPGNCKTGRLMYLVCTTLKTGVGSSSRKKLPTGQERSSPISSEEHLVYINTSPKGMVHSPLLCPTIVAAASQATPDRKTGEAAVRPRGGGGRLTSPDKSVRMKLAPNICPTPSTTKLLE